MSKNPTITQLDPGQIVKRIYDEANDRLRVDASVTIDSSGSTTEVVISQADDSIRIGDGTNLITSTAVAAKQGLDVNLLSLDTLAQETTLEFVNSRLDTTNASLSSIDTKLTSVATATKQDTGNTSLGSIDTKLTTVATSTKQDTGNTSLSSIDGKLTTANTHLAGIETNISGPSASTATLTQVASSATSVTLISANPNRRGLIFFNDSQYAVYVAFATTAATGAFSFRLTGKGTYESTTTVYKGEISAIWASAGGQMQITELE